jgi:hypothetical protein
VGLGPGMFPDSTTGRSSTAARGTGTSGSGGGMPRWIIKALGSGSEGEVGDREAKGDLGRSGVEECEEIVVGELTDCH